MEPQWYYASNGQSQGPVPESKVIQLIQAGEIAKESLVWVQGMANWTPAGDVEALSKHFPSPAILDLPQAPGPSPELAPPISKPTPPPVVRPEPIVQSTPLVTTSDIQLSGNIEASPMAPGLQGNVVMGGQPQTSFAPNYGGPLRYDFSNVVIEPGYEIGPHPWHRYWARFIDNICTAFFMYIFLILLAIPNIQSHQNMAAFGVVTFVVYLIVMPIEFFCEALFLSMFGTTVGKFMLNIHVRRADGQKLSFIQALQRTGAVWVRGGMLYAIVPLLGNLVTIGLEIYQYLQLTNHGITSWDRNQGLVYTHGKIGSGRIAGYVFFAIVLILVAVAKVALAFASMNK